MKKIEVFNYQMMQGEKIATGENNYTYKPVIAPNSPLANQCHIAFVEVGPKQMSFSYHYHETDEEVFYIISGEGCIRTPDGDIHVKAGDAITFPPGPSGAHSISNPSLDQKLVYIDFDTHNLPEITHFPDTGRVEVLGAFSAMSYSETTGIPNKNPRRKHGVRE